MNLFFKSLLIIFCFVGCVDDQALSVRNSQSIFYVDAINGDDTNDGTEGYPWKTLNRVSNEFFLPGDNIYFKRGTSYSGCVTINGNGNAKDPILVSAYGIGDAPKFTNPYFSTCNGNAMRIRGDYHIVENLYFHDTAPAPSGDVSFETVWSTGALHIDLGSDHVIVRNNEFANIPKAIQSYSQYSLITRNYIHDGNIRRQNGFLSKPWWGPIGIQLGIGNQEVSHNTIENMYASGGEFGADGGAIEIDDGRNHKDNIYIHNNKTFNNMGFIEISYWDDIEYMSSKNVVIEYNFSRDYQSFLLWWAPTESSIVKNNTIIRVDNLVEGPWNAVFIFDSPPGDIELNKNIIVINDDLTEAVFIEGFDGAVNDVNHINNCYWNIEGSEVNLGQSLGQGEIFANPLFLDFENGDYNLQVSSPAKGWGAFE